LLPPSPSRSLSASLGLGACYGRARTTRLRRPQTCRSSHGTSTSTAFRSTFVTTRTPLVGAERSDHTADLRFGKAEYFTNDGLTGFLQPHPSGKSAGWVPKLSFARRRESIRPRILGPALLSLNQRVPGSTLVHPPSKFFNLHRDLRSQVSDVYLAADPNLRK
jgi:hypothetical protein